MVDILDAAQTGNQHVHPSPNKKINPALVISGILLVVITPLIVIFVSQPQLIADIRSRAYVSKQTAQRLKDKFGITSKTSDVRKIDLTNENASTNTAAATPTPTPTTLPTPTPTPTSGPTATPTPTPVSTNTPTPTPISTDTPTPTPTSGPTSTPTPTPQQQIAYVNPTATPTPIPPASCNNACTVNANCASGLVCVDGTCRNASCTTSATCSCVSVVSVTTPGPTPKTPISGGPTVLGASIIGIGALLLILGLAL